MLNKRQFTLAALAMMAGGLPLHAAGKTNLAPKKALVIVSLADNENQGIVPTTAELGDGQNPRTNLYWGAMYGVKSYFKRSEHYTVRQSEITIEGKGALEQISITPKGREDISIDAVAFEGHHQKFTVRTFYSHLELNKRNYDLIVFVGHNPLMDFGIRLNPSDKSREGYQQPRAVVLACQSRSYFTEFIKEADAIPYVFTSGNMAPEAYSLDGIFQAWMNDEGATSARARAAENYAKYQKIPLRNAMWLFKTS